MFRTLVFACVITISPTVNVGRTGTRLGAGIIGRAGTSPAPTGQTDARFNRAVQLQQQGRLAEAADEYRALLKVKPDYAEAQANLGVVLAQLGQYDEAITAYDSALRLAPHLTPILLNLGIAHYRAGQFARAAETFRIFLERNPDSAQARQLYGLSLVEIGQDIAAIVQLELTLDAAPQDVAVLYSLGLAYLHLNRPETRDMVDRLAAFHAGQPISHLLRGQSLIASGDFERAIAELEIAAKMDGKLPRVQYSLGLAYQQLGRSKEALTAFQAELSDRPNDFLTLYYVALLNEGQGNLDAAERHLSAAMKLVPDSPDASALLGKILFKRGKASEAIAPLEFSVGKNPTDPDRRYLLARVYQQLGRREDAEREFAEVQRLKANQLKQDRTRTPKP
ncbi:MAG: tetratricopeptide repeat protein [Acidobacteriota bacterium]